MANHSPDGIGEVDRDTVRDMAKKDLTPELCELFFHHLDGLGDTATGVADPTDPINILHKLRRLSADECISEVRKGVGKAVLDTETPIDVFFDCLPTPEEFEKFLYGKDGTTDLMFMLSCKHAVHSFKALTIAYGKKEMIETFRDPVLYKLFLITDRAACDNKTDKDETSHRFVLEELLSIGSSIRRVICPGCSTELTIYDTLATTRAFMYATNVDMEQLGLECQNKACPIYTEGNDKVPGTASPRRHPAYNDDTVRLLGYLSWLSHGRKDSEYTSSFRKRWNTVQHPASLGSPPGPDLSRLPLGLVEPERRNSCPDIESLYRRTTLFIVVLKHYIMTSTGTPLPLLAVKVEDGVIKATLGRLNYSLSQCEYAGIAPSLNLDLPEVQGALHAFCCREMQASARALFEYFFLGSGVEIEFMDLVPKNVHQSVVQLRGDRPRWNMIPIHTVAVLTTKSGLQFVLDPTAPQYGWREIFAPLDVYTWYRVDNKLNTVKFVPLDPNRPPTDKTPAPRDTHARAAWRRTCVAEYTLGHVKGHIPNGDLGGVINRTQDDFDRYCRSLDRYLAIVMGEHSKQAIH